MTRTLIKLGLICKLLPNERTPLWFGFCWRDWFIEEFDEQVLVAVIPLNLIFRVVRVVYLFLRWPFRSFDAVFRAEVARQRNIKLVEENAELRDELFEQSMELQERIA